MGNVWATWLLWVTAGEFAGFLVPTVVAALTSSGPLLVLAGVVEGMVLGGAQCLVLRRVIPRVNVRDWIGVTALAAGLAWAIALFAVHNEEPLRSLPPAVLLPLAAIAGIGVVLSIGVGQWFVLRRHVDRAFRWVWLTGAAWCAGLLVFATFTSPLWRLGQPTVLVILIGAAGGLLMAATMAFITGAALAYLLGKP